MRSCLFKQSSNSLIAVIKTVMMLLGYKPKSLLTRAAQRHQGRCSAWNFPLEVLLQPAEGHQSHFTCGALFPGFAILTTSLSSQIAGNDIKQSTRGRLNDQHRARCMAIPAEASSITSHMEKLGL